MCQTVWQLNSKYFDALQQQNLLSVVANPDTFERHRLAAGQLQN